MSHTPTFRQAFDWEDPHTYFWELTPKPKAPWVTGVVLLSVMIILPLVMYGMVALVGLLSPTIGFWVGVAFAAFIAFGWVALMGYRIWGEGPGQFAATINTYSINIVLVGLLAYVMSHDHFWAREGFEGPVDERLAWGWFFAEGYLRVLTLDAFELLGWHLSDIYPVSTGARLWVFAFNTLLTTALIDGGWHLWRTGQEIQRYYGTVRGFYHFAHGFVSETEMTFRRRGRVQMDEAAPSWKMMDFLDTFEPEGEADYDETG
ncbi:MAG: hypothetical protein D6722_08560 [Bacteroidetes bacterium]|nr:MAG: hypothetical protein D6722_08560 [Bacteroidota bacterium]